MLNIPTTIDDPNYRYKMPKLLSKIEGRGNGIRTKIVNMADISRALKRPPAYPTKFFGCELGALSKWEDKEEKSIVNGAHQQPNLQKLMDKFIQMYVLCPNCELPEIDLMVKKDRVCCKCNACGYSGLLDNNHKISTYISKNPPASFDSTLGNHKLKEKEKEKEKKKKEKEKEKEKNKSKEKIKGDTTTGTVETDKSKDKHKKKKKSKKPSSSDDLLEDNQLSLDSSEIKDVVDRLQSYVLNRGESLNVDDFFSELRVLQVSQNFDSVIRFTVVLLVFFDHKPIDVEYFKFRINYISKIVVSTLKPICILSLFETYCVEINPNALSTFPYLLQQLYDADIISEASILKYYQKDSPSVWNDMASNQDAFDKAKASCLPFVQWLLEASDDSNISGDDNHSDEDEDEDEDDYCEYDDDISPINRSNIKTKSLNLNKSFTNDEFFDDPETVDLLRNDISDDSDLNIDDI